MASRNDIADSLRELIASGGLKAGDPLPSSRELVARYGGGKETALAAIRILAEEGLVSVGDRRKATVRPRDEAVRTPERRLTDARDDLVTLRDNVRVLKRQVDELEHAITAALSRLGS